MELTNDFRVGVPIERAWEVLTDVERIAPCLPGAQLQEIEGDEYRGVVKVKVGPITAQYKGAARFLERDDTGHRAVLRAEGRETRGQGNAHATITAQLEADGDGTKVSVVTDLTITGKVAQFGRGVLADVSSKLLGQFVDCLESELLGGEAVAAASAPATAAEASAAAAGAAGGPGHGPTDIAAEWADAEARLEEGAEAAATSGPAVRVVEQREVEPVDLLEAAGAPVARRLAPAVIGVTVLWLLGLFLRRRKRRRQG